MFKKYDWIIPLAALLLAAAALLVYSHGHRTDGAAVTVTVDGTAVGTYPLDTDRTLTLTGWAGGTFTMTISDGEVSMLSSDCPDKICVRHAAISRTGECIICLPNRAVLEVIGAGEPVVDAVSQ